MTFAVLIASLGVIETERTRSMLGGSASVSSGERLDPADIAKASLFLEEPRETCPLKIYYYYFQAYVSLSEQGPSAWTHELDLRCVSCLHHVWVLP